MLAAEFVLGKEVFFFRKMHGEAEAHRKDRLARATQTVTLKRYVLFGEIGERGWGTGWRDKRSTVGGGNIHLQSLVSRGDCHEKRNLGFDFNSSTMWSGDAISPSHLPLLPKESLLPVVIAPNDRSFQSMKETDLWPMLQLTPRLSKRDGDQRKQSKKKKIPKKMSCRLWQGNLEKETEIASFPHSRSLPLFPTVNHIPGASPPVKLGG